MKELPGDVKTGVDKKREEDRTKKEVLNFDEWRDKYESHPRVSHDSNYWMNYCTIGTCISAIMSMLIMKDIVYSGLNPKHGMLMW